MRDIGTLCNVMDIKKLNVARFATSTPGPIEIKNKGFDGLKCICYKFIHRSCPSAFDKYAHI